MLKDRQEREGGHAGNRLAARMSIWITESFFLTHRGTELLKNRKKYSIKREGTRIELVMLTYRKSLCIIKTYD